MNRAVRKHWSFFLVCSTHYLCQYGYYFLELYLLNLNYNLHCLVSVCLLCYDNCIRLTSTANVVDGIFLSLQLHLA